MEFKARQPFLRVSPRKLRLVADLVRGRKVQTALDALDLSSKRWAKDVAKLVRSAVNNASQNRGVNVDALVVKKICVDQGPTMKRFMTRARGSGARILKRTSHMFVVLDERK